MTEGVFIYYVLYNCCVFNFLSLKNKKKEKKKKCLTCHMSTIKASKVCKEGQGGHWWICNILALNRMLYL